MKKVKIFFTAIAALLSVLAYGQNITVTGVVTDGSNGEPLPGAAILVKGTSDGVVADAFGNYSINVPANATLGFTTIGFKDQEINVNGRTVINVALESDTEMLEDVIVVAYGTVRREANTGSVTSLKGDALAEAPVTSVDKMLAGKMAGVKITSGSGQPGSTSTIRVRGTSSLNAGNEPLWVIDGIPVMAQDFRQLSNAGVGGGSSSTFLNPNDIESITVLKDAAAASVYGSRAANGVILVTTKSGKSGKAKFTARAKYGVQDLINDNNLRPLTGAELLEYRRVAAINAGYNPDDPTSDYYYPQSLLADGTTNWYKELTKQGSIQEYEVNATGGNDKSSYYSSLSYHKNDGVFYGIDYQRFTARVNADAALTKKLKTGARISVSYADSNSGQMGDLYYSNPQYSMWTILPWTPMYNPDGSYNTDISENSGTNPRADASLNIYNDKEYRLQGNMYLEWKPIQSLSLKTTNGVEYLGEYSRQYWDPKVHKGTSAAFNYWSYDIRYTTSNTVTFNDMFGNHSVRVLAGQEAMTDKFELLGGYSPNVDPAIPYPTTSTPEEDQVEYSFGDESMLSFFGVADYNFASKYFVQASVRTDGSSLFGSQKKWGTFWSVGGSWVVTNENFMKSTQNWLNQLKVRASYGVNGNNNISAYRAYGVYGSATVNGGIGFLPSTPDNPNLSWEKNKTWDAGLDFGFFDNRLSGSIDVYSRITEDMLLSKQVPYTTGFGSNFMNIGSLSNKGLELQLDGDVIRTNDFVWSLGGNIAFNRSKVLDLGGSEFLETSDSRAGGTNGGTPVRIVEGKSLYTFYLRDWYGVNPSTGAGLWWTEDDKLTSDRSKARYIYCGSPEPKATGGVNTSLSWKGFSLSAFLEFVYGNKVVYTNNYIDDGYDMTVNTTTAALNYWTKPGDTGVSPQPVADNPGAYYVGYSTRFLQNGSYCRIKDVTLSYTIPSTITDKIKMNGIKVYVSALNPYTFHGVTAMDPEFGTYGYTMGAAHSMVKSFIGGVEVSF